MGSICSTLRFGRVYGVDQPGLGSVSRGNRIKYSTPLSESAAHLGCYAKPTNLIIYDDLFPKDVKQICAESRIEHLKAFKANSSKINEVVSDKPNAKNNPILGEDPLSYGNFLETNEAASSIAVKIICPIDS